jgi:hypothetical protein
MFFKKVLTNKESIILGVFCSLLTGLCIGLWQKMSSITNPETHSHKHQHTVFQSFTSVQRDSIINIFYGSNTVLRHEMWGDLPIYIIADSLQHKPKKSVFFLEEDVPCPICQDVYFLLEIDNFGEIIDNIHFIQPFESFSGWIPQEKMKAFKQQFLRQSIVQDFGKFDVVTGATNSSRQFYRGLDRVKQVLLEKGQN